MATWNIDVNGFVCADLGSNTGGFVDCLLRRGATRIYAIDTGYGVLDWKLRKDPRVVVMERTNAMHASLPEQVALVTIDVAWTKQKHILPAARRTVQPDGSVITLIKPHYEAPRDRLRNGILLPEALDEVVAGAVRDAEEAGFELLATLKSPITGAKGNVEMLAHLKPSLGR